MLSLKVWLGAALLGAALGAAAQAQTRVTQTRGMKLRASRQLIVVTTADWNAVPGALQRYERRTSRGAWQPVGAQIPIVVGRNGLAWGDGLHGAPATLAQGADPLKKEGDGKAPAGAFRLNAAFGYLPKGQAGRLKLPYVASTATMQCVDDAQSAYYNRVVERARLKRPDWQSHEDMLRKDEFYRWGVVVEHNAGGVGRSRVKAKAGAKPGGGSCIFLHIWGGANSSTAGCTAMEAGLMEEVLRWLDAKKQPVLVQLPVSEYERLKQAWGLPDANSKTTSGVTKLDETPRERFLRKGGKSVSMKVVARDDGEIVSDTIMDGRDMRLYEQAGHFDCRYWAAVTQSTQAEYQQRKKASLMTARNFIWEHWQQQKRGYVRLTFDTVDATSTSHIFIEPAESGRWRIFWKIARIHVMGNSVDDLPVSYSVERKMKGVVLVNLIFKDTDGDQVTAL